jgi:serine/threonine-protein kinase PRP4
VLVSSSHWTSHPSSSCTQYKNGSGLSLSAVRTFGRQLFRALRHIHSAGIVHADIKPDNIVLNRKLHVAKICDFGSAYRADELGSLSSTQYIVARYYRAPEIVLGYAAQSAAMDVWSMGVTLVEMYTSKLLFTGRHNNALLKSIMDLLGPVPKPLIRRSEHRSKYFRHDFKFLLVEENRGSGTESTRPINPTRQMDLVTFLSVERNDSADDNTVELQEFEDLVRQCLQYNPAERITAEDALKHPFFKRANTMRQQQQQHHR